MVQTFTHLHVVHVNPEEISRAKFNIFIKFENPFKAEQAINGICNNTVNFHLKAELLLGNRCIIYANVSEISDDNQQYFFKYNSDLTNHTDVILNTKAGWQMLGDSYGSVNSIYIHSLTLEVVNITEAPYKNLYKDTDLTDFKLQAEDTAQAVPVHRNILALSSPVLKAVVQGKWNESKEGHIKVPDVSSANLQDFKKYIYLKELPESPMNCAKLLPLAAYYMMPELKKDCILKIADIFKPEDGWEWFEDFITFVVQHKSYHLLSMLFKNTESDKIKALEEHFSKLTTTTTDTE